MSNLNDISKAIELTMINDEHLFGEPIEYYRLNGLGIPIPLNAGVQITEDSNPKIADDPDLVVSDSSNFISVELVDGIPIVGDKIIYDGTTWYVKDFLRSNKGVYDITCTRNRSHTASRSKRRR